MNRDIANLMLQVLRSGSLDAVARHVPCSMDQLLIKLRGLEQELGVQLLRFRSTAPQQVEATEAGRRFLQRAPVWLQQQRQFEEGLNETGQPRSLRVYASHYLASYLLIDLLRQFRIEHPDNHIRVSVRTEQQILGAMLQTEECAIGLSAPVEFPEQIEYRHWFDMDWHLVVPSEHPLSGAGRVSLRDLAEQDLILFEPGSTGRQHVLEAFHAAEVRPRIALQATTTTIVLQMVEAGLGVSLLPMLASGRTTAGMSVSAIPIVERIQPIQSGIFVPMIWAQDPQVQSFLRIARQCER